MNSETPREWLSAPSLSRTAAFSSSTLIPEADPTCSAPRAAALEPHSSLHDNLAREVFEETGLGIEIGAPCLVNEFHDPDRRFHQVEIFFRARVISGEANPHWQDPDGVVTARHWVTRDQMGSLRVKPSTLADIAFEGGFTYDPLEAIVG